PVASWCATQADAGPSEQLVPLPRSYISSLTILVTAWTIHSSLRCEKSKKRRANQSANQVPTIIQNLSQTILVKFSLEKVRTLRSTGLFRVSGLDQLSRESYAELAGHGVVQDDLFDRDVLERQTLRVLTE